MNDNSNAGKNGRQHERGERVSWYAYPPSTSFVDRMGSPKTYLRDDPLLDLFEGETETQIMRTIGGRASAS